MVSETSEANVEGAETRLETLLEAVPRSANDGEAAAIAAALGAHLRDRAVAGADESDAAPEQCNRWTLCGRLGGRTPPKRVARGGEWKAAARSRW